MHGGGGLDRPQPSCGGRRHRRVRQGWVAGSRHHPDTQHRIGHAHEASLSPQVHGA
jgi:hypothetical protein